MPSGIETAGLDAPAVCFSRSFESRTGIVIDRLAIVPGTLLPRKGEEEPVDPGGPEGVTRVNLWVTHPAPAARVAPF